jgi:hypothetical protein
MSAVSPPSNPAITTSPQNQEEIGGEHRHYISIVFALHFALDG